MLNQRRHRWKETQHQLQQNYLRVNQGSKETKTSSNKENREAKKIYKILIAQDRRPAALTLWPSSTILLITQTKLLWAASGDMSNTKRQPGALNYVYVKTTKKTGREGGKNLTHYHISCHKELGPICIHPCKQGQATKEDSKHTCIHCRALALGTHQ